MRIEDEQYWRLVDRVTHEGSPQLLIGPVGELQMDLPLSWISVLRAPDPRADIARLWRPMEGHLPRACRALHERLSGIALLCTEEVPCSLLYLFADGDDLFPYRGYPPLSTEELRGGQLPDEFLDFYLIHNGWLLYYAEDCGPVPKAAWSPLSSVWTEVAWKLPPGDLSPDTLITVFRDGHELALAFDTSTSPALPMRCRQDGTADVLLDMWVAIDREISGLLEALDSTPNEPDSRSRNGWPRVVQHYQQMVARVTERRAAAAHLGGGAAHEQASDLLLNCALLEKQAGGRREAIVDYYRHALRHWCASIDLGGAAAPTELLDWFGVAHALGDNSTAHYIATIPTSVWADDSLEALQARALMCLFLGDVDHATAFVEELLGLTFDGGGTPDAGAAITVNLLQSLTARKSEFYAQWRERAVAELCTGSMARRALLPWNLRLAGFDAVASRLEIHRGSYPPEDSASLRPK